MQARQAQFHFESEHSKSGKQVIVALTHAFPAMLLGQELLLNRRVTHARILRSTEGDCASNSTND